MQKGYGLKKRFLLNLYSKFIRNEAKIHELRYLFWECTLRCNLNCLHCGSDCTRNTVIPDMPADDFLNQMEKLAKQVDPANVMVVITGGEPLIRKDLEDIGFKLRLLGFRWGIVSNALAYSPERHKSLMHAGMGAITISLDGLEANHNWLRNNRRSYQKVTDALQLITREKLLTYDVVTCVNRKNIYELEALRDELVRQQVKAWRIFTIAPIGRAADEDLMKLSPEHMQYLMEFIYKDRDYRGMKVSFSCEGFVGPYEGVVRDGFFFCRAGIHIGSILVDGSVSACPNIDRAFTQGSIYEEDFIDIWNSKFQVMRDRNWTKTGICSACDNYNWCRGNAMHLWNGKTKTLLQCHCQLIEQRV